MAGCVLRVRKKGINLETLLAIRAFRNAVTFIDGFNFTVSENEEFAKQIKDSNEFLKKNSKDCASLSALLRPEAPVLDFGVFPSGGPVHSFTFPSSLVSLAGSLGFELCASLYEASDL